MTGAHETDNAGIGPFRRTEFLAPQKCVHVFVDTAVVLRPRPAVSFPKSRVEVVAYREGNSQRTRYLPGRLVHDRLVLQRAAVTNSGLHAWWRQTVSGAVQRRSMSVILLDATAQEAQRWNVFETRPVSYDVTDLSALGNDVVLETIEIVHEGLELAQS